MQLAAMLAVLTLAAQADSGGAGSAPAAEKAKVTVQVLSAKAGTGSTGDGVDARLAEKIRVSLAQLGMNKPDITGLVKPTTSSIGPGETVTVASEQGGAEVTCKSAGDGGVTVTVTLYTEGKDGKKKSRKYSDPTSVTFSKSGQVQPFVQADGKAMRIFVVSAERDSGGSSDPPKDKK